MTLRLAAMGQEKYQGLAVRLPNGHAAFNGTIKLDEAALGKPYTWKKPTTVFVNSMSDLFHKDVPETFIRHVFDVMADTPQHTYQVLTKRPERMADVLQHYYAGTKAWSNIWCGTSVENQWTADERIPHLLEVPAAIRFLSCEPLLGPLDVEEYLSVEYYVPASQLTYFDDSGARYEQLIHWLIAGSESGHGARPAQLDWFRGLRDQCQSANVCFFLKQFAVNGKKVPLPELDGRQWKEMPR